MSRKVSGGFIQPRNLCFNESDFLKDAFDIDNFLREHRDKASLEMMRDDLGAYLKTLRMSMIELINKDYEDFVNLSKDLIGLDSGIHTIQVPLSQLRDEIMDIKKDLDDTIENINNCILQRKELTERKKSLLHLMQVITSLDKLKTIIKINTTEKNTVINYNFDIYDLDLIERAALEYNQLQFSMFKCKNELISTFKEDSEHIGNILVDILSKLLLEYLREKQLEELGRCLRIFAGLDKIKDAEELIRKRVIYPFLERVVTEKSLLKENDKMVYENVINFIDSDLKILLDLTTSYYGKSNIKGYNFMINSFWPELEAKLEKNLPAIILSGNPELFHSKFINCKKLVQDIENRCGNRFIVMKLRECKNYQDFFQKQNLLVYFKMRFQEIAGQFETELNEDSIRIHNVKYKNLESYNLKPAMNVIMALKKCWTKEVYLPELAHMFWKLSLQIISRYTFWLGQTLAKEEITIEKHEADIENMRNSHGVKLDFLVCLFNDTKKLCADSNTFLSSCKEQIPNRHLIEEHLSASLSDSICSLELLLPKVTSLIVKVIVCESVVHLKQMSQIPRDFRRTNRESPTKPCEYVASVLSRIKEFYNVEKFVMSQDILEEWMTLILNEVSVRFYFCVNEVLKNDQKIEESIRKLKKIKDNYSHKNSDDDKIRQQLVIDILSFIDGMNDVNVKKENIAILNDLLTLLESLKERSEKQ